MKFILSLSLKVKIIIAACAVAAAAVVGTVIILNSEEAYRVIKVFELNGSAVVTRVNTGDIDAYAGMNLESGDVLSVEKNSTLRISLDSDKYILLDGGTILELIAQGTEADSKTTINLQEGTILNEIKNSLSANSSYEVNTPKATMAVRGTIFKVTTLKNPDGSYVTDVYTSEGVVSVQLLDENGEPKGKEVYVPKGGAVTIITDINDKTGNPAGVDGNSYFVLHTDDGSYAECGEEDAVYYPNDNISAEVQTEHTVTTILTDTERFETNGTASETEPEAKPTDTTVPVYETNPPVSDVPTVTTVPMETTEPKPVTPSEIPSETTAATTTTSAETTKVSKRETTVTSTSKNKKSETEESTASITEPPQTAAETTATAPIPFYPEILPPIYIYPPIVTTAPNIPSIPTVPTAPIIPTETENSRTVTSDTKNETSAVPTAHKVSFIGADGSVISEAEFGANETLGAVPQIPDKRGYTGKWVSGGAEVTENTIVSEDMDIRLEYTPMPVTVIIAGPVGTPDGSGTETIFTFTVPYDGKLSDSGYTIARISQAAYDHYAGTVSNDYSIKSINVLYPDYAAASNNTVIAGDAVVDVDGGLVCYIICNFD